MKSLGETYKRRADPASDCSPSPVSPQSGGQSGVPSSPSTLAQPRSVSNRGTLCVGDVIAVVFGVVVLCLGVVLWISPEIGLFGENIIGLRRLAEFITGIGINAIAVWSGLIYSLDEHRFWLLATGDSS